MLMLENKTTINSDLWTPKQVADYLQMSVPTLDRRVSGWRKYGVKVIRKNGLPKGHRLFKRSEILKLKDHWQNV